MRTNEGMKLWAMAMPDKATGWIQAESSPAGGGLGDDR